MKLTIVKGKIKAELGGIFCTFIITAGCLVAILILGSDAIPLLLGLSVFGLTLKIIELGCE